jgi:pimeloyl-ACP methyl ester carboxylesterase
MGNTNKVHKRTKGHGKPPVIFISGADDNLETWDFREDYASKANRARFYISQLGSGIQTPVSEATATLSFDWPGSGKSTNKGDWYSPEKESAFVAAVAASAGLKPPFVLVGHSLGCITALTMLTFRPKDVAGIVLIDPLPFEDYIAYTNHESFHVFANERPEAAMRVVVAAQAIPQYDRAAIKKDKRIRVHYNIDDAELTEEELKGREQGARIVASQFENVTIHHNKTHHIHLQEPDAIIKSILQVVAQARG